MSEPKEKFTPETIVRLTNGQLQTVGGSKCVITLGGYHCAEYAYLISAAPDLYAANKPLEEQYKRITMLSNGIEDFRDTTFTITLTIGQAKAILAAQRKARGEK